MAKQNRNPYKIRETTLPFKEEGSSRKAMRNMMRWRDRRPCIRERELEQEQRRQRGRNDYAA